MTMTELPWPVRRVESALEAVELGSRTPAMTVESGRAREVARRALPMPKEYLGLAWRCRRKSGRAGHGGLGEENGIGSRNSCLASVGTCDQVSVS